MIEAISSATCSENSFCGTAVWSAINFIMSPCTMTLPAMTDAVTKIIAAGRDQGKQTQVFIRGDKAVDYGAVMGAMGGLQKAGVGNVGLITEAP